MKFPWHKRILSHAFEQTLEIAESEVNEIMKVSLVRGELQLSTRNAIYSFGDLYDNFRRAFEQFKWDEWPGDEVLLLGLGLGSIPYMLERTFERRFRYTAVEIDEVVVRLAYKYVIEDLDSPVVCYTADAALFVQQDTRRYDMICVDVFEDDVIPESLQSEDFLLTLGEMLTDHGVVLYNVLARTRDDRARAEEFRKRFVSVFPDGGFIDARGNWILLNNPGWFKESAIIR